MNLIKLNKEPAFKESTIKEDIVMLATCVSHEQKVHAKYNVTLAFCVLHR